MKKETKLLFLVFFIITIIKIILNYFVKSPSSFSDSYFYTLSAKALIGLDFSTFFKFYPPLYSLLISWAYLFNNYEISYFLIKLTNSILSSLIIFPSYFLAKEYLKDEKLSFYSALIIALLPSNLSYSSFIMSENIFNLLVVLTVYILYLVFVKSKKSLIILSSILISLCYMTRTISFVFFPIIILYSILEKKYKEGFSIIILSTFLLIPFILIKGSLFVGYEVEIYRISEGQVNIIETLFWILLYPFLLYLQGFIIFTNSALKTIKLNQTTKLFILFIISFVGIAAYHAIAGRVGLFDIISGRPIGRYTAPILPLIIIMGIKNIRKFKINYFLTIPFAILMLYPLLPPNNIDISWLGWLYLLIGNQSIFLQLIINLCVLIILISLINYLRRYITLKRLICIILILNLFIWGGIVYDSNNYYFDRDDTRAGIYLNKLSSDAIIVIDPKGCDDVFNKRSQTVCDKDNKMSLIGFWNKKVIIGDYTQGDYFVSKEVLQLKKIKQFGEVIIYET